MSSHTHARVPNELRMKKFNELAARGPSCEVHSKVQTLALESDLGICGLSVQGNA